jgi:hypothetical protein
MDEKPRLTRYTQTESLTRNPETMLLQLSLLVGALAGLLLVFFGIRRWRRRGRLGGTVQSLSGLLLLAAVVVGAALLFNVYTYQRLNFEQPIAELRFESVAPQNYRVFILAQDGTAQRYELRGDEWQLDARILKWHGVANLLGVDAHYRLERLSGRYRSVQQERTAPRTVYQLFDRRGIDLWELANRYPKWLPGIDAIYGSAAFLPMADGAHYSVSHTQSGLVARALNSAAVEAIEQWR